MTADGLRRHLAALAAHVAALEPEVDSITVEGARRHLVAIRGTVDAMLGELALAAWPGMSETHANPSAPRPPVASATAPDAAPCTHPEDDRTDAASLRNPSRFYCRRCGSLVNEQP